MESEVHGCHVQRAWMSCAERNSQLCEECMASRCALLGAPVWHWLAEGSQTVSSLAHRLRRTEFFLALLFFRRGLGLVCRAHLRTVATSKVSRLGHISSFIGCTSRHARRHRRQRRIGAGSTPDCLSAQEAIACTAVRLSRVGAPGAWSPRRAV